MGAELHREQYTLPFERRDLISGDSSTVVAYYHLQVA